MIAHSLHRAGCVHLRVIVVGGGIGGAASAIALRQEGFDPLVLERSAVSGEVGAGLGLAANAMKVLDHFGVGERMRTTGVVAENIEWRGLDDDEEIFVQRTQAMAARYGHEYHCAHRADLLDTLVSALPGERLRLGSPVVAVHETPSEAVVELESGEELACDLVVGADGLRSTIRTCLFGDEPARFTGFVVWRAIVPAEVVPERFARKITTWLGVGRHSMLYPVRADAFNLSGFMPAEEVHGESWTNPANIADLRRVFADTCPEFTGLFDSIARALITPLYFRDPLERWSSGRVVLLGDAAHPMPPSAGQGAAMALEDAVTLAACLRRAHGDGAAEALSDYHERRRLRTSRMLVASRINLALFNESDPVLMRARNSRLRALQRLDPAGDSTVGWQYGHDAVAAAEAPSATAAAANPLVRPQARRAFDAWRAALTLEDHAGLWPGQRAGYERFLLAQDDGSRFAAEEITCDGVAALRVSARADPGAPVVFHLHGGGLMMGSARAAAGLTGRLAEAIGGWGLAVDYRLAPEHPYPAALEDCLTVYRWLLREHPGATVLLSGECGGGGLAVSLALALRDHGEPLPLALHVASPLCDLTVSGESAAANSASDPWLSRDFLLALSASYLGDASALDPRVSPVFADLRGLPPILIHAATGEVLADDARALARAAEAAGVPVILRMVDDSVHSFLLFDFLPESDEALAEVLALVEDVREAGRVPAA